MTAVPAVMVAMLHRDWKITRSYRLALVAQTIAMLLALFVAFHVSRLVEPRGFEAKVGIPTTYFSWVVVGIAVQRLVHAAVTICPLKVRTEQTTGTFESLLVTPAAPATIVLGGAAYELALAVAQSVLIVVAGATIFGMSIVTTPARLAGLFAGTIGCIACFLALSVLLAALAVVVKQIGALANLIPTLLAIIGGVYFPIALLPHRLEVLARALPIHWALEVARHALLGGRFPVGDLVALLTAGTVGLGVSLVLFGVAVERARKTGTLAHY